MFTVTVTDPQLEKFAKHYEVALNRYFEEHPEMVELVDRLTAERIAAYWREIVVDVPVEVLPPFLAVSSGEKPSTEGE